MQKKLFPMYFRKKLGVFGSVLINFFKNWYVNVFLINKSFVIVCLVQTWIKPHNIYLKQNWKTIFHDVSMIERSNLKACGKKGKKRQSEYCFEPWVIEMQEKWLFIKICAPSFWTIFPSNFLSFNANCFY